MFFLPPHKKPSLEAAIPVPFVNYILQFKVIITKNL